MFQLIVATRNRNIELSRLLQSLDTKGNISYIDKLIIVDQSDSDTFMENKTLISKFIDMNNELAVTHIRDKRKGLSRARNLGLKHIKNVGYLCFPDDDCWYSENFFSDMADRVVSERAAVYVTYYREQDEERLSHKTDYKVNWSNLMRTPFSSVGIFIDLQIVRSERLYFDENIGAGTDIPLAEDTLLCYRLFNEGYKISKISHPHVYHRVFRGEANYISSAYSKSYIMLHNDLGFRFKALFIISFLRTATRALFSSNDRLILKGKLALLKDKTCR